MNKKKSWFADAFWSVVALLIIVGGIAGFRLLGELREPVSPVPRERSIAAVETVALRYLNSPLPIRSEGFIQPSQEGKVAALRTGRVIELHPAMLSLGSVKEGDVLLQLDDRAARAQLARVESDIASSVARLELNATQLERTQELRRRGVVSQEALDQRLSQQTELEAALESAKASKINTELDLENTRVLAPFDAQIQARRVELGDVIAAGAQVATLVSAQSREVTVALTEQQASLVPNLLSKAALEPKTPARVTLGLGSETFQWPAEITRINPAIDANSRLIEVTLSLDTQQPSTLKPLINGYATVVIAGATNPEWLQIPIEALQSNSTLWLAAPDSNLAESATDDNEQLRLLKAPVNILLIESGFAYVHPLEPIPQNARLIISPLDTAVSNMPIIESNPQ